LKKLGDGKSRKFRGKDEKKIVCFECKKFGHHKSKCLELTSKKKDKKKNKNPMTM